MNNSPQQWVLDQFNRHKHQLIERIGLTSGMEFTEAKIISTSYHYNRYGITAILEIQLFDNEDPEFTNLTIATVYKNAIDQNHASVIEKLSAELVQVIESRQSTWISDKNKIDYNFDEISEIPDQLFTPEIIHMEDQIVRYASLNRFVRRDKSGIPPINRYRILGYTIGRFHGFDYSEVDLNLYSPHFNFLKEQGINDEIRQNWTNALQTGKGGTGANKYIYGDFSLENVQYNALSQGSGQLDSLGLLDPVLIQGGDRTEDLGSVLAFLVREKVTIQLLKHPEGSLRDILTQTLRYIVTQAGKEFVDIYLIMNPSLLDNYEILPIDFFLGVFLLQYSSHLTSNSGNEPLRNLLTVIGEEFLSKHPFNEVYKL